MEDYYFNATEFQFVSDCKCGSRFKDSNKVVHHKCGLPKMSPLLCTTQCTKTTLGVNFYLWNDYVRELFTQEILKFGSI